MDNDECDFIKKLLTRNLTSLCRNSLPCGTAAVHVDAVIGVTLMNRQVILVNVNQSLDEDIKDFAAIDGEYRQFSSAIAGQKTRSTSSSDVKTIAASSRSLTCTPYQDGSVSQTDWDDTEDDDDCVLVEKGNFDDNSCTAISDDTNVDEYCSNDQDSELPLLLEASAGEYSAGDVTGPYLGDESMLMKPTKRRKISDIEAAAGCDAKVIGQPLKSVKPGVKKKCKSSTGDVNGRLNSVLSDEDVQGLLHHHVSKRSEHAIQTAVTLLSDYADRQETSLPYVEQLSAFDLDKYLAKFFTELKKPDGSLYSRNSLQAIKHGLQRHFRKFCGIDILGDPVFKSFSKTFSVVMRNVKAAGRGDVIHKQPLTSDDYNKLYFLDALNTNNPVGLQNKVFVDVMLHLCHRGRETLRYMTVSHFDVVVDHTTGKRYVCMKDFLRQYRHADVSGEPATQGARMYERLGDPRCSVLSFEKYVAKLNKECTAFWQKPNVRFCDTRRPDPTFWYHNIPIGCNALICMMRSLSAITGLSHAYTNHCLRATNLAAVERSVLVPNTISVVLVQQTQICRNVSDGTNRETIGMALTRNKRYE